MLHWRALFGGFESNPTFFMEASVGQNVSITQYAEKIYCT